MVRYEKYWLPLVSAVCRDPSEDLLLAPPLDVHWAWHVHMLAPQSYAEDCARAAGRVVDHKPRSLAVLEASRSQTANLVSIYHYQGRVYIFFLFLHGEFFFPFT